jgi:hypothetical protein
MTALAIQRSLRGKTAESSPMKPADGTIGMPSPAAFVSMLRREAGIATPVAPRTATG